MGWEITSPAAQLPKGRDLSTNPNVTLLATYICCCAGKATAVPGGSLILFPFISGVMSALGKPITPNTNNQYVTLGKITAARLFHTRLRDSLGSSKGPDLAHCN